MPIKPSPVLQQFTNIMANVLKVQRESTMVQTASSVYQRLNQMSLNEQELVFRQVQTQLGMSYPSLLNFYQQQFIEFSQQEDLGSFTGPKSMFTFNDESVTEPVKKTVICVKNAPSLSVLNASLQETMLNVSVRTERPRSLLLQKQVQQKTEPTGLVTGSALPKFQPKEREQKDEKEVKEVKEEKIKRPKAEKQEEEEDTQARRKRKHARNSLKERATFNISEQEKELFGLLIARQLSIIRQVPISTTKEIIKHFKLVPKNLIHSIFENVGQEMQCPTHRAQLIMARLLLHQQALKNEKHENLRISHESKHTKQFSDEDKKSIFRKAMCDHLQPLTKTDLEGKTDEEIIQVYETTPQARSNKWWKAVGETLGIDRIRTMTYYFSVFRTCQFDEKLCKEDRQRIRDLVIDEYRTPLDDKKVRKAALAMFEDRKINPKYIQECVGQEIALKDKGDLKDDGVVKKVNQAERKDQFRQAFKVLLGQLIEENLNNATDKELCEKFLAVPTKNRIGFWTHVSEQVTGMTNKFAMAYFQQTFSRALYEERLTEQDKATIAKMVQAVAGKGLKNYQISTQIVEQFKDRNIFPHDIFAKAQYYLKKFDVGED
ncbi:Conserved_hypothetical protein [Hexamita inflata]|uniref:Uncharacterized protein n=1 Tax=Hexamita inflata TaxID=28002 RepID=A0AA86V9P6_9EUKA|nr:Conserved hypothetical protein [Hexamita inflata]